MKTHKSGAKRYKVTATGKIMKRHAGIGHLLANKSSSRKRKLFSMDQAADTQLNLINSELPYKKYSRQEGEL